MLVAVAPTLSVGGNLMAVRQAYGYDVRAASKAATTVVSGPSKTRQSDARDADINVIVKRFGVTGEVPITKRVPMYGEFETFDLHVAHERLVAGQEAFMQVPADIRLRFHNDPVAFAAFCTNPLNKDKVKELGLAKFVEPPKVVEPTRVVIVGESNGDGSEEPPANSRRKPSRTSGGGDADGS